MATQSIFMLCQPHCKVIYYISSKNALFYCRNFVSNQEYSENTNSKGPNRSPYTEVKKYAAHFKTLELSDDSDRQTVRRQYINLVKKYHPDTASNDKDKSFEHFHLIDQAYKELQNLFASQAKAEEDCEGEYGLYYKVIFLLSHNGGLAPPRQLHKKGKSELVSFLTLLPAFTELSIVGKQR